MTTINMADVLGQKIDELRTKALSELDGTDAKTLSETFAHIARLERQQNKLAKLQAADEPTEEEEAEERAARETIKAHIRATILSRDDYYYVLDAEKFFLYRSTTNEWIAVSDRGLRNHHPRLIPGTDYYSCFIECLKDDGRWFYSRTSSFEPAPGKLNMLRPQLLEPQPGTPHPLFGLLLRSLCGDKAENVEHLERVIVAKHNVPSNYLLPVLCFSDDGATGKSLFASTVMTTLFGRSCVSSNTPMGDFAGQFNGHLAGKLFILINENVEDRYNHNRMKAIAGSPTFSFTVKNQMPFDGDNTALLMVTGNSVAGSIRVDGGDVDRRFSVIRGTSKLSTYTVEWLRTENPDITVCEAEDWMVNTGQHILRDPDEVAIWLHDLYARHGALKHVRALHGEDYQAAVGLQTPLYQQCFEAIFGLPDFTYIRRSVLYDFYRAEAVAQGNRQTLGKKKFYVGVEKWLAANRPEIVPITVNWGKSSADVYALGQVIGTGTKPTLQPNDSRWCIRHEIGSGADWQVSI